MIVKRIKLIFIAFIAVAGMSVIVPAGVSAKTVNRNVGFQTQTVEGVGVHTITVNLADKRVRITSAFCPGYSEIDRNYPGTTMNEISRTYSPDAIINGTFFDSRSYRTVCNISLNGKLICEGDRGSTLYIDRENNAGLLLTSRLRGRNIDWSNYSWAIQSGPTLLYNGNVIYNPKAEGFSDPSLFGARRRTAAGITRNNKIIFLSTNQNITLEKLSSIMKKLGCIHAINLDGGGSSGLGFRGNYPVKPGRTLANFILVYENQTGKKLPDYPDIRRLLQGQDRMRANKYRKMAENFASKGRNGASLNYLIKACRIFPMDLQLSLTTAQMLEKTARTELAAKFYGKTALNAMESGDSKKARKWAEKSLQLDKNNSYALEALRMLDLYPQYCEAIRLLSSNQYYDSFKLVQELLAKDKNNPRFFLALGRIFTRLDNSALKARAYYLSAQGFKKQGNRNYECYLMAKNAVEADPGTPEYRLLLSNAAKYRGDHQASSYHMFLANHLKKLQKSEMVGKGGKHLD